MNTRLDHAFSTFPGKHRNLASMRITVLVLLSLACWQAPRIVQANPPPQVQAEAARPSRIVQRQGRTETVAVPAVAEPWSATAVSTPPPPRKVIRFVGRFPGFKEAKQEANRRARRPAGTSTHNQAAASTAEGSSSSQGVVFDGPNESDTSFIPPNPGVAAGPDYLVVLINSLIVIYDKSGVQQGGFNELSAFFSSLGVTGDIYDPRVIYDQNDNRFIMSFTNVDLQNPTFGNILIAVSQTSDPTGNWYKFEMDSKGFNSVDHAETFPDFPTLGLSSSAIYISNGQFELNSYCTQYGGCSFSDTWLRVIGLPELLSGNQNLNITTFKGVETAAGSPAFAIEGAVTLGSASQEFLVAADFSANPSATIDLFSINTSGAPVLSSGTLAPPGKYGQPPNAPQPGTGTPIDTADFRMLNAVWSNGSLWCAQNVADSTGQNAVAAWYQVSIPDLADAALAQSGQISGSGNAYFPSVTVKPNGEVIIPFTTSSPIQYASAAFTGRASTDPAGTMRSFSIDRAGTDSYVDFALRWGDYNGSSLDPDGESVWMIVEYAGSPNPHFQTAVARTFSPPALSVSPVSADFGKLLLGTTSSAQTFTVTNFGPDSLTVAPISLIGANSTDFALAADACSNASLKSDSSCTFGVTFTATVDAEETAQILISTEAGAAPQTVLLQGRGVVSFGVLQLSPTSLTFPATPVGTVSAPQQLTLTNVGTATVAPISFVLYGPFTETDDCKGSLAPAAHCTINVVYRPTQVFGDNDTLLVQAVAEGGPVYANLSGNGIAAPEVVFCPSPVAFSNQQVGSSSSPLSVTITNAGLAALQILSIHIAGDYTQTNDCDGWLAARTACIVSVTFRPTASGTRTGTLTMNDNASGSPHILSLSGTGVTGSGSVLPPQQLLLSQLESRPPGRGPGLAPAGPSERTRIIADYTNFPLAFEPNRGQADPQVKFISRGRGRALYLTAQGAVLALTPAEADVKASAAASKSAAVAMSLVGSNAHAPLKGLDPMTAKTNYFLGSSPDRWRREIPNYSRVEYHDVFPGIDLVFYGRERQMEYDFVVAPGADPQAIRLRLESSDDEHTPFVASDGDLVIPLESGEVRLRKPVAYQTTPGDGKGSAQAERHPVAARFVLEPLTESPAGNSKAVEVAFDVGAYDRSQSLILDPVLAYSTFLGGGGIDAAEALFVDTAGNAYITGTTNFPTFPTVNAFQPSLNLGQPYASDAFVAKLNPSGTGLVFSTYLGGSGDDSGQGIGVDAAGNVVVAGTTSSKDFPLLNAIRSSIGGTSDGFVTKLNPQGNTLVYSTYLGGNDLDEVHAVAVDSAGDAYLTGKTQSDDFPSTSGAFQTKRSPGVCVYDTSGDSDRCSDAFVTKLNADGTLAYSSYLGGTATDVGNAIAVDASGNAYVGGQTYSLDFPITPGVFQPGSTGQNSFVAKLKPDGSGLVYASYLGGSDEDVIEALAVDSSGSAYVTGFTYSQDFPLQNAFQATWTTGDNAFVTKFHPAGCALVYSTYLGGSYSDEAYGITVDRAGDAYVVGGTASLDFPMANPIHGTCANCRGGGLATFVTELSPPGSGLLFSTYLDDGTSIGSGGRAIALDPAGNIYVAGETASIYFPVLNAIQDQFASTESTFVAKISTANAPQAILSPTSLDFGKQVVNSTGNPHSVLVQNYGTASLAISSITGTGNFGPNSNCGSSLAGGATCSVSVTFTPTADGTRTGTLTVTDNSAGSPHTVALTGAGVDGSWGVVNPQTLDFGTVSVGQTSKPLSATFSNTGNRPLNIQGISSMDSEFVETNTCGAALAPGASCQISVTFTPTIQGQYLSDLIISDDAANNSQSVALTGIGQALVPIVTLSSTSLTLGSPGVGSASSPQTVTLTNTGNAPLNISSINLPSGPFTETNNCSTSVAVGASCVITVVYTPSQSSPATQQIAVNDNAQFSPQFINLQGQLWDFSLSATNSSQTVAPGGSASYTVSIAPLNGSKNAVNLSCTDLASDSNCSLTPQSQTLDGTHTASVTVTVTTTAPSFIFPQRRVGPPGSWPHRPLWIAALALLLALLAAAIRRQRVLAALAAVLVILALWASCGGGDGGGGGGGGGNPGTPSGTYNLTITGASGGVSHTLTLTLVVN